MRYTRYEYKKSGKMKFICSVAVIIGISIGGGLYISNFLFHGKNIQVNNDNSQYSDQGNYKGEVEKFVALQCGYYSKEENAKELLTSLSKYCDPFIVEEDGKFRVLAGIYKEEDGLKKIDEFKTNKIDVAKINLNIPSSSEENKEIIEIIDGFLTIANKLEEASVKSIKTAEFKEWVNNIINNNNVKSNNSKKLDSLSSYVNGLPDEMSKGNGETNMKELYKIIRS